MATGRIGTTPVLQVRWSKAPSAGTTSLSGLDDNSVSLVYSVGYEAVYRNGVLLSRTNDYTATNGTTVTLTDATITGDIIEIFANNVVPLTDTYSQGVADSKFINNSLVDAKGDILTATAADTPARLAVGANDTVLTADSSTSTGLKWATPAAGGMTVIASGSFSGSSIVLSSIPATYKNLQLAIRNYKPATDGANLSIRFNGDSTANRYEYGTVNVTTDDAFERTEMQIQAAQDNTTSNGLIKIDIFDYTNTVTWKIIDNFAFVTNPSVSTQFDFARSWGVYNQTAAISSITLFPSSGNFTSGNYILYGVS
jgi:hypothetical protein